jgi:hypothetical protein
MNVVRCIRLPVKVRRIIARVLRNGKAQQYFIKVVSFIVHRLASLSIPNLKQFGLAGFDILVQPVTIRARC